MSDTHTTDGHRRRVIANALHAYATLHLGQTFADKQLAAKLETEFSNPNAKTNYGSHPGNHT